MSETVELLRALIRNACVNDGTPGSGQEIRSVETLHEFFGRAGTLYEPVPGRASTIYRIPGTDPTAPALMMMGHLDVVPVNESGWSRDPFAGDVSDGFVWGRGAVDMLNLTAAMAVAFKPYLDGSVPALPGDLVFLAVADEEAGGGLGARPLVDDRWDLVATDYLLTEIAYPPLRLDGEPAYPVSVGEKGPFWTVLRSRGRPGHGSVPYGGDNAMELLVEAMGALFRTPSPVVISDVWRAFVESAGFEGDLAARLTDPDGVDGAIEEVALSAPRLAAYLHACTHLTVSPNVIHSGVKANVIPDVAEGEVDFRTLPGQDRSDVDDHIRKAVGSAADRLEIVPVADHVANESPVGTSLWECIVDSIEAHTGSDRIVPTLMPATTDARFFRARGVTAYGVGLFDEAMSFPDFLSMFHGHDERVSVASVDATASLLSSILSRWRVA
ncbi:MAG TPA: M20/M25/M40 family metallo-hydrolase [Acidimicrobiia bacterium]|nr:M20/M25/M40 family metallo-hydrolase [Acidimicrobiia bacterium]